jgi:geranylgeranyl diphosphate synthase type II
MNEEAIEILKQYGEMILPQIMKAIKEPDYPAYFSIPKKYEEFSQFHQELIRDYPERKGKYIRPTLLLLTCEAMGKKMNLAITTATAMQISEEWLLIHDDLEDNSMERRGGPALHKLYSPELAINAGDALHVVMWNVLSQNDATLGNKTASLIRNEFYTMISRTTVGQTIEIKWAQESKFNFTDEDWFFICDGKTSYYTIAGPLRLGAIIAGATQHQLDDLSEFGMYLGRTFQLVDDILDITSDFGGLKKQKGNDIYEGKKTVILGHLLRTVNEHDRNILISIFKRTREEKTEEEIDWVISKMEQYGSVTYAREMAKEFKEKAYSIFSTKLGFLSAEPARERLEKIMQFVLERDR